MATAIHASGLTDTDILIDATRGVEDAVAFLTEVQADTGVRISIISAMELVAGCRNRAELARVQQFLQRVTVLPVSDAASQTAYQLMESFFLSHGLLIPDALIAATALERGLALHSKNIRHFQMIPALMAVRPY
ncbi:MAG: type II toxin-antitoxin system VapC family toxin [Candidatus Latescibacteria bacterium]|nr:type II toxin-antitoxin system VapC family toxin [Candidatus Latescibacterota bacterium]